MAPGSTGGNELRFRFYYDGTFVIPPVPFDPSAVLPRKYRDPIQPSRTHADYPCLDSISEQFRNPRPWEDEEYECTQILTGYFRTPVVWYPKTRTHNRVTNSR